MYRAKPYFLGLVFCPHILTFPETEIVTYLIVIGIERRGAVSYLYLGLDPPLIDLLKTK